MAINIKNLEESIQKKAHLVDSNTSVDDLTDMVEASLLLTGSLKTYADSSELPTATGSNEKIGFIQDIKAIRFNNGKEWVTTASGEVQAPVPPTGPAYPPYAGGSNYGYSWGGSPQSNRHMRFSLSSDGNATLVEYMAINVQQATGGRSPTHGYYSGGFGPPAGLQFYRKFPWASEASDAQGPSTTFTKGRYGSHANPVGPSDFDYIYMAGGYNPGDAARITDIERFPVASDTDNATDVGDLVAGYSRGAGATSGENGYILGGQGPPPGVNNQIQKFPFAATATGTDAGDLTLALQYDTMGANSETHGYSMGGQTEPPGVSDHIDKFAFATDGNSTDVGNLTVARSRGAGVSSTTHGYALGGTAPSNSNVIDKFAFASDGNATDVGDLTEAMSRQASTEN